MEHALKAISQYIPVMPKDKPPCPSCSPSETLQEEDSHGQETMNSWLGFHEDLCVQDVFNLQSGLSFVVGDPSTVQVHHDWLEFIAGGYDKDY